MPAEPMQMLSPPIGLLGGTFDPIHLGHLRLAEKALETLALAQVCFSPAGQPPHRDNPLISPQNRLHLVRLAIANNPGFTLDDSEIQSTAKSYTVLTLQRLRNQYGSARPLVLILGSDAFQGLPSWFQWTQILELAHIAVTKRPDFDPLEQHWLGPDGSDLETLYRRHLSHDPAILHRAAYGCIVPFTMTPLSISASHIRELISAGQSPRYLLPDPVLDYIELHHLYR